MRLRKRMAESSVTYSEDEKKQRYIDETKKDLELMGFYQGEEITINNLLENRSVFDNIKQRAKDLYPKSYLDINYFLLDCGYTYNDKPYYPNHEEDYKNSDEFIKKTIDDCAEKSGFTVENIQKKALEISQSWKSSRFQNWCKNISKNVKKKLEDEYGVDLGYDFVYQKVEDLMNSCFDTISIRHSSNEAVRVLYRDFEIQFRYEYYYDDKYPRNIFYFNTQTKNLLSEKKNQICMEYARLFDLQEFPKNITDNNLNFYSQLSYYVSTRVYDKLKEKL